MASLTSNDKLVIGIHELQDLVAKDLNGLSDPYVKVTTPLMHLPFKTQTEIIERALDVRFEGEEFVFPLAYYIKLLSNKGTPLNADLKISPTHTMESFPFTMTVYDFDKFSDDDFLGKTDFQFSLSLGEAVCQKKQLDDIKRGNIKFSVMKEDVFTNVDTPKVIKDQQFETMECTDKYSVLAPAYYEIAFIKPNEGILCLGGQRKGELIFVQLFEEDTKTNPEEYVKANRKHNRTVAKTFKELQKGKVVKKFKDEYHEVTRDIYKFTTQTPSLPQAMLTDQAMEPSLTRVVLYTVTPKKDSKHFFVVGYQTMGEGATPEDLNTEEKRLLKNVIRSVTIFK